MKNRASLDPIVWSSFGLLMLVFGLLGFIIAQRSADENTALKAEITEWQRAMLPAYYARYPEARMSPLPMDTSTFDPALLRRVLNPCTMLTTSVLLVEEEGCAEAAMNATSYGSRGIPINIILAR